MRVKPSRNSYFPSRERVERLNLNYLFTMYATAVTISPPLTTKHFSDDGAVRLIQLLTYPKQLIAWTSNLDQSTQCPHALRDFKIFIFGRTSSLRVVTLLSLLSNDQRLEIQL